MNNFKAGQKLTLMDRHGHDVPVEVICFIGDGNQGDVYKVRNCNTSQIMAMKHLYGKYALDKLVFGKGLKGREAFFAKCLLFCHSDCPHPSFAWPRAISGLTAGTKSFLYTMPLITGYQDFNLAIKDPSLTMQQRAELALAVLDPMIALHKQHLVYGDVSNTNILYQIDPYGRPRVAIIDCENISTDEFNMGLMGSGDFLAPEQVDPGSRNGGKPFCASTHTDIHGICVLLFELFCRSHPLWSLDVLTEEPTKENFRKNHGTSPRFCMDPGNDALPIVRKRWNQLPEPMRLCFAYQFSQDCLFHPEKRLSLEEVRKLLVLSYFN